MAYLYTQANDLAKISEQEYGTGEEIWFTYFDSCIGVIARKGDNVTGVHLVRLSKDATYFDNSAAQGCVDLLPDAYDDVVVFGVNDEWEADEKVKAGYAHLLSLLTNPTKKQYGSAKYGFRVKNSKIQFGIIDEGDKEWYDV